MLAGAWLVLYVTKGRFLRHPFERIASAQLARQVTVGGDFNLYFDPIDIAFRADDLHVDNPRWAHVPQLFAASHLALRLRLLPLIFGKREISWLVLDDAALAPEWDARHQHNTWTFGDPRRRGTPFRLPEIGAATISRSTIDYRDPLRQLLAHVAIDSIAARDTRVAGGVHFTGSGSWRGKPVAFNGAILNPNQAVAGSKTNVSFHADLARTVIDGHGTLPGATELDGMKLAVTARGADMSDLFHFIDVQIARTRAYHLRADLTYTGADYIFTHIAGAFGDSDLAGKLVIAMPRDRLKLTADLSTHSLDLIDAGPFIGYDPQRLDAMGGKGAIRQVGGHPRLLPDATIPVDRLQNFDADVDYRVDVIRNLNTPISDIAVTLALDHGRLHLAPARANVAGGTLTADVVLDTRAHPVIADYDLRLSPTPVGHLLARFGVAESGTTGTIAGRIRMRGAGASVAANLASSNGRMAVIIPSGTLWERNVKLSELNLGTFAQRMFNKTLKQPVEVNCGLIAFTVRGGVATADPLLIDTRKSVLTGNGGFSFRDEAIDLSIRDKSKTFSLFSLQSPVGIDGYLAAPGINVLSKSLVARVGTGVLAGVVLSPIATVAAFVDLGRAKAAACGPVLAGDTAARQLTAKGKPRQDVGPQPPKK